MADNGDQVQDSSSWETSASVYLTGFGPVCPLGLGAQQFAARFWSRQDRAAGIAGSQEGPQEEGPQRVPEFELADYVGSKRPYLDPHSRLGLAAAALALESSGRESRAMSPGGSGLCTATMLGNLYSQEVFQRTVREKGIRLASPVLFPHCYPNTTNSLICIELGLRGYNQNFCGDALSGAHAVQAAYEAIRSGAAELMLAGGCDAFSDRVLEVLRQESDTDARWLSEGAGFLVLENERSVARRAATPLCKLAAVVSLPAGLSGSESAEETECRLKATVRRAVAQALQEAQLWEGNVGVLFTAGPPEGEGLAARAGREAVGEFSQLPVFGPEQAGGRPLAATFALQCMAAALVVGEGTLPSPAALQNVKKGIELWVQRGPAPLLAKAGLLLQWSERGVVAAVLVPVAERGGLSGLL